MRFFEHHIGDWSEATAHLNFYEDAAYSRLIRKYYATEEPLCSDPETLKRLVGARSPAEREAVDSVLYEFFELTEDGWRNSRCDKEIEKYQAMQDKSGTAAKTTRARVARHRIERQQLLTSLSALGIEKNPRTPIAELRRLVSEIEFKNPPEKNVTQKNFKDESVRSTQALQLVYHYPSTNTHYPLTTDHLPTPISAKIQPVYLYGFSFQARARACARVTNLDAAQKTENSKIEQVSFIEPPALIEKQNPPETEIQTSHEAEIQTSPELEKQNPPETENTACDDNLPWDAIEPSLDEINSEIDEAILIDQNDDETDPATTALVEPSCPPAPAVEDLQIKEKSVSVPDAPAACPNDTCALATVESAVETLHCEEKKPESDPAQPMLFDDEPQKADPNSDQNAQQGTKTDADGENANEVIPTQGKATKKRSKARIPGRIPENWRIPAIALSLVHDERVDLHTDRIIFESRKFKTYWLQNKTKNAIKKDWDRAFFNWICRVGKYDKGPVTIEIEYTQEEINAIREFDALARASDPNFVPKNIYLESDKEKLSRKIAARFLAKHPTPYAGEYTTVESLFLTEQTKEEGDAMMEELLRDPDISEYLGLTEPDTNSLTNGSGICRANYTSASAFLQALCESGDLGFEAQPIFPETSEKELRKRRRARFKNIGEALMYELKEELMDELPHDARFDDERFDDERFDDERFDDNSEDRPFWE